MQTLAGPARTTATALRDGSIVHLRRADVNDAAAVLELLRSLSLHSRAMRFGSTAIDLPSAARAAVEHVGVIAFVPDGSCVGHAWYVRTAEHRAEAALVVADGHQGRGLGTILLKRVAELAALRGMHVLEAYVVLENVRMTELLRDCGLPVRARPDIGGLGSRSTHPRTRCGMRLDGKVAVITGPAKGIGLATAKRFLDEGARVVAADLSPISDFACRERLAAVTGDVSRRADAERIVESALDRFGRLDILINNAGIVDRFLPVGELTDDIWERVLAINLTGPMYTSRAAIPLLLARGGRVIVNIASVSGLFGARAGAAYVASKHGLIGLTRNIAATYGSEKIRAVALCPGGVNTGICLGGEPSARGSRALNRTLPANPRMAEPAEIASVLAFLASDEASFVNGAAIVADGGWMAA